MPNTLALGAISHLPARPSSCFVQPLSNNHWLGLQPDSAQEGGNRERGANQKAVDKEAFPGLEEGVCQEGLRKKGRIEEGRSRWFPRLHTAR
ncbi:hypothetical protein [Burkholderia ubonensis]|uniref:hypothetical protein n=1 Tax=Burkholderia ubonensis TaxID=101571 RepID=UPI0012BA6BB9|nr:hypothetical protein [Burkholderia ubonensis]